MKNQFNGYSFLFLISAIIIALIIGLILGMLLQQKIFYIGVGHALSYTSVNVNFNETKLVEEMNKTLASQLRQRLNKTTNDSEWSTDDYKTILYISFEEEGNGTN